MFVQGLLTAEMRLWQMELQRRLGQGRLSEFVGHLALPTDKMMRTLGFYDKTLKDIDSLDTEAYEALESYVKGVNAYIDRKPTLPLKCSCLDTNIWKNGRWQIPWCGRKLCHVRSVWKLELRNRKVQPATQRGYP